MDDLTTNDEKEVNAALPSPDPDLYQSLLRAQQRLKWERDALRSRSQHVTWLGAFLGAVLGGLVSFSVRSEYAHARAIVRDGAYFLIVGLCTAFGRAIARRVATDAIERSPGVRKCLAKIGTNPVYLQEEQRRREEDWN